MKQAIAANYLGILDKCLKQQGLNNFLKEINVDQSFIHDPLAYISQEEFTTVLHKAYQWSGLPHLGLLFGEQLSIVNHGFLGYAAMTSPTLGAAIQTLMSYLATRTALLCAQLKRDHSEKAFVELKLLTNDSSSNRFLTEMAIVHLIKLRLFLINVSSPALRIEIAYPEPFYGDYYRQFLPTQIKFNAQITRIVFLASELDAPISFADDASYQQAKQQLQAMTEQLLKEDDLPGRIKTILYTQDLYQLTMEDVASQLCLSTRTLRRHLQTYDITYQELLDGVRQQKAQDLLINTSLSITEISFLLGFRDLSNFTKAFKRWTKLTPTDYREEFSKS